MFDVEKTTRVSKLLPRRHELQFGLAEIRLNKRRQNHQTALNKVGGKTVRLDLEMKNKATLYLCHKKEPFMLKAPIEHSTDVHGLEIHPCFALSFTATQS